MYLLKMNVYKNTCLHSKNADKKFLQKYINRQKLVFAPRTIRYSSLSVFFSCYYFSSSFTSRFFILSLSLSLSPVSIFPISIFLICNILFIVVRFIHRLTSFFPVKRVCSRCLQVLFVVDPLSFCRDCLHPFYRSTQYAGRLTYLELTIKEQRCRTLSAFREFA